MFRTVSLSIIRSFSL